jgi:basic membrane lipoprotein Med (substrate-binding protein (PBP1-ABC) superfamily)
VVLVALGTAVSAWGASTSNRSTEAGKQNEGPQVRVITATPTTAGVWDPTHYAAYSAAAKKGGWRLQVAEAVPYGNAAQVFRRWGEQGVDVVFSTDNGFEAPLLAAAKQFPETAWVMMSGLSSTKGLKNVAAHTINWCQIGYLLGAAGAMVSKSHTIGGVGALHILPADQVVVGLGLGSKAINPRTKILTRFTGDFVDTQKAQAATSGLISQGADVIVGITTEGMAPQVASRAQSQNAYYIGDIGDVTRFAPKAVVSSVVAKVGPGYTTAVNGWMKDEFDPSIHIAGVKDGALGLQPLRLGFGKFDGRVRSIQQRLASGNVSWPKSGPCAGGG